MEKNFNQTDSLRVIDEMIAQAKYKPGKWDGLVTLLWGYLVLIASLLHWYLEQVAGFGYAPAAWLLMVAGVVATSVIVAKTKQKRRVKTYIDTLSKQLWTAFGISFAVLFFALEPYHEHFLPSVMVLYGLCMWMQGSLIKYNPYKFGAFACWLGSGLAFWMTADQQLLVLAGTVLFGYIVPGHMLYAKTKTAHV